MPIIDERGIFWWNSERVPRSHFAPQDSVNGHLKIDDDGRVRLEIDGQLPTATGRPRLVVQRETPRNIQGLLKETNQYVLLIEAMHNGGTFRTSGISYEEYFALHCLKSKSRFRADGLPAQSYHSTKVELKGYENWLRLDSISVDRRKTALKAAYRAPKNEKYAIPAGTLSIEYDMVGPYFGSSANNKLDLRETAYIRFAPQRPVGVDECVEQYLLLQDIFILLTDSDFNLTWPTLTTRDRKSQHTLYFLRSLSSARAPRSHECLILFPQVREILGVLFSNWMEKRQQFGPAFYLFLGTRRGMKMYTEHRFVNLMWGLEAFDRKKHGDEALPDALQAKIARIVESISIPKDKKWLLRQLRHSGEPTLEQRLIRTFSPLGPNLDQKALADFCKACAHLRNDLSHFGGSRHAPSDYSSFISDVDKKSDALSALYHLTLLQEIGVPHAWLSLGEPANWAANAKRRLLKEVGIWKSQAP